MALAANIVLADALATPVNHTFIPLGKDAQGVYWYEDQSGSSPLGYNRVSIDVRKPLPGGPKTVSSNDRVTRVKYSIHLPSLETLGTADNGLTPPATMAYICRFNGEFILPERSILQNRKDLRKYAVNLPNDAQFVAAIENLIPVY